jgi:hypothetical protein
VSGNDTICTLKPAYIAGKSTRPAALAEVKRGNLMKAGIIGIGSVGRAAALAAMQRGSASELVLVDRTATVSKAVALDLGYGIPLGPSMHIVAGDYSALAGAGIVVVTAGVNEKAGGATDRNDPPDGCACSTRMSTSCRTSSRVLRSWRRRR